jgi:hypothetical protein
MIDGRTESSQLDAFADGEERQAIECRVRTVPRTSMMQESLDLYSSGVTIILVGCNGFRRATSGG